MRIEVIIDGKSSGKHEFLCQPRPGDQIELEGTVADVEHFRHSLTANRGQILCKSVSVPVATAAPVVEEVATPAAAEQTEPEQEETAAPRSRSRWK